jgi:hypothetical protein
VSVRALRGFVVDLLLAAAAGALRWHPVYDFFQAHPALVYWGVGLVHIAVAPVLAMHGVSGGREAQDLVRERQGIVHGRLYRASFVAVLTTGFCVPFLCALTLPVRHNTPFGVAVFFAPYAFVAVVFLSPLGAGIAAYRRTRFLFLERGRLVLGAVLMVYLALMECTMFLCVESREPASLVAALLGLVLSYLPTRLIVFYGVTQSQSRAEVLSLVLSTAFLAAQLVVA